MDYRHECIYKSCVKSHSLSIMLIHVKSRGQLSEERWQKHLISFAIADISLVSVRRPICALVCACACVSMQKTTISLFIHVVTLSYSLVVLLSVSWNQLVDIYAQSSFIADGKSSDITFLLNKALCSQEGVWQMPQTLEGIHVYLNNWPKAIV